MITIFKADRVPRSAPECEILEALVLTLSWLCLELLRLLSKLRKR